MQPPPLLRALVTTGVLLSGAAGLAACGQKGPLQIPDTPAAAQRATLPQTVLGGSKPAAGAAPSTPSRSPSSP